MSEEATPQDTPEVPPERAAAPEVEPESIPPSYMTMDQFNEVMEQREHNLKSWIGRRDTDLFEKIKTVQAPPADPSESRDKLLENPEGFFNEMLNRKEQQTSAYMSSVVTGAGSLMEVDPLFKDRDFGNEVVKEITKIAQNVDKSLPTKIASERLVSEATLAVIRRQKATPTNPLAENKPTGGLGSVSPPSGASKKAVKAPKISGMAKKYADKWGYTPEKLAELFPDG